MKTKDPLFKVNPMVIKEDQTTGRLYYPESNTKDAVIRILDTLIEHVKNPDLINGGAGSHSIDEACMSESSDGMRYSYNCDAVHFIKQILKGR